MTEPNACKAVMKLSRSYPEPESGTLGERESQVEPSSSTLQVQRGVGYKKVGKKYTKPRLRLGFIRMG